MQYFKLAILAIIFCLSLASAKEDEKLARGGIILAIGKAFFEGTKDVFLERLINKLQILDIKSYSKIVPLYLFNVNLTLSDFNLKNASYDKENTTLKISKKEPHFDVVLHNMSFIFELNYQIYTDKELLEDNGTIIVKLDNLCANMSANPLSIRK